jgi:hypothetical protein
LTEPAAAVVILLLHLAWNFSDFQFFGRRVAGSAKGRRTVTCWKIMQAEKSCHTTSVAFHFTVKNTRK